MLKFKKGIVQFWK